MYAHRSINARVGRQRHVVAHVLLAGAALASLMPGHFRAAAQTPETAQVTPQPATPQSATPQPATPQPTASQPRWRSLLDSRTLVRADKTPGGWQLADQEEFAEHGKVHVDQGNLILERGYPATGVRWTGPFPKTNYELRLDAKRTDGGDFFCGLTFPVGAGSLTLILGGWGGWAVGLSCIDGEYAIDNETCTVVQFKQDR